MSLPKTLKNKLLLPIIGAPMFRVSTPKLVIAQCKAGIIGTFPSLNARPQSQLKDWIQYIKSELHIYKEKNPEKKVAPFGVNLVAISSNKRLKQDTQVCLEEQVPIIITSMQPPKKLSKKIHEYRGLHYHDVTTLAHAKKALKAGVDGLVLVCNGAGGHGGRLNPFALVKEVRQLTTKTLWLAGALTSAEDLLAAQVIGADGIYIGTRFIATKEAEVDDNYKQMIVDSQADDIRYTPHFTAVNANFLAKSIQESGLNPNSLQPISYQKLSKLKLWFYHLRLRYNKKWKDIRSAGQGVGTITKILSVKAYISILEKNYNKLKENIKKEKLIF